MISLTKTRRKHSEGIYKKLQINTNQLCRLTILIDFHCPVSSEAFALRQWLFSYELVYIRGIRVLTTRSRWWARAAANRRRWQRAASLDGHHCPNVLSVTMSRQQQKKHPKNPLVRNSLHFNSLNVLICFYVIFFCVENEVRSIFLNSSEISRRVVRGSLSVGDRDADWRSPGLTPPHAHRQTIFALFWLRF